MTLAAEMKKLRESKAYYAAAGARDLAAEKLRDVPDQLRRIEGLKGARRELSGRAQSYAVGLTGKAAEVYGDLGSRALEAYEGLAERGRHAVNRAGTDRETSGQIESASTPGSGQRADAPTPETAESPGPDTASDRTARPASASTPKSSTSSTTKNKTGTTKKSS